MGDYEDYRDYMGEGIHSAFRKASDHKSASLIHQLINDMPDEEWRAIVDFVAEEMWQYPKRDHRSEVYKATTEGIPQEAFDLVAAQNSRDPAAIAAAQEAFNKAKAEWEEA